MATSRQGVIVCAGGTVWCVCLLTYRLPVLSCCCNEFILVMMVLTKSTKAGTLASLNRLRILTYACSLFCRSWLLILPLFQKPILFVGIHISMWGCIYKTKWPSFFTGRRSEPRQWTHFAFFYCRWRGGLQPRRNVVDLRHKVTQRMIFATSAAIESFANICSFYQI